MRHPDMDLMIVMERRREELAQAAQSRLLRQALGAGRRPARAPRLHPGWVALFLARALSFLGARLLNWSCRLQYRYLPLTGAESPSGPCR